MSGFTWFSPPTPSARGCAPPVVAGSWVLGRRDGLGGRSRLGRIGGDDPDALRAPGGVLELDGPVDGGEHGVVAAEPGARAGQERHAALADDDRSGSHGLAVTSLDAESLANAVAAVLRAGTSLLVGHG